MTVCEYRWQNLTKTMLSPTAKESHLQHQKALLSHFLADGLKGLEM